MAPKRSAGILLYRRAEGRESTEVLIGHMGGPYWQGRDERGWSIPKGAYDDDDEEPIAAARREFEEETGHRAPHGEYRSLGEVRQRDGKLVSIWAVLSDLDPTTATSNTFTMEWPRGSGRFAEFPEIDRFAWCALERARELLVLGQVPFIDALVELVPGSR